MVATPSKGLLDFYNNQVLKKDSLWNQYAGAKSIGQKKTYTKPWDQLTPSDRFNLKRAYENFKKFLPTYRRIAQQNLISVDEAGKILGIPERRGPPTAKYSKGRMTSGFPITISDSMTRGAEGGLRAGSGQEIVKKILKPKFKLQQIDVGLGKGNKRWFIKDPRKVDNGIKILQDYYLRKGRKSGITTEVINRVKALHRNPTIINLLKEGNFEDGRALSAIQNKWGWTPSEASTAVFRLAQTYNGKDFINVNFKLPENKAAARAIFEAIEKSPWGSAFHARGYQIAMDTITENLGEKYFQKGTMDSFKREIRTILNKEKIPVYDIKDPIRYGFNLNEMIGVSPAARTGSHPYSQFVNLMEGKFNQGHYAGYVKKFGDYQAELQEAIKKGDPGSVIKKFNAYNKEFRDIHNLQKADLPTLSLKDPSKLYSAKRLKELADQGIDLGEYFEKSKYSIGVGEAPTIKEIKQSPESLKKLRVLDPQGKIKNIDLFNIFKKGTPKEQFTIATTLKCVPGNADGGRIGYALGTGTVNCVQTKLATETEIPKLTQLDDSSPGLTKMKNAATGFLGFVKKGGKFGALAAAGAAGAGLVKTFMNDDPTTYLSDENQQKNMLIDMVTSPMVDQPDPSPEILDWQLPVLGAAAAAGTAAVAPSTIEAARSARFGKKPSGITKTALKTLGRGVAATGTPLGLAAFEPVHIASQIQRGDSLGEIATDPWNYAGLAFADDLSRFATKGLGSNAGKIMRLGISPAALRMGSRFLGLPGLALSLGISGYETYDDWKNKRGWFREE